MRRLVALLLLLPACDPGAGKNDTAGDGGDTAGDDTGEAPEGWCAVQSILVDQCASCHDASSPSGDLDLETDAYAALVNQPSRLVDGWVLVVPGDPDASFLYAKVTGVLASDEGDPMPGSAGLDAADADAIAQWIVDGATSDCANPDTGGDGDYHPDGFDDPDAHGLSAKLSEEECVSCHGNDLTGGSAGVSCDTCHPSDWRTDCVFCHGGTETDDGAPPRDIDGSETNLTFDAHTTHVTETIKPAYACVQCHDTHTDVLSDGHLFLGDTTPGVAEVDFSGGIARGASRSGGTCSNVYCHGNGQTGGSIDQDDAAPDCGDCHAVAGAGNVGRLSGEHGEHDEEGVDCEDCHGDVVSAGDHILDPTLHVDGAVDLALPNGMSRSGNSCSGSCHGEDHRSEGW